MSDTFRAETAEQLKEILAWATAGKRPIELLGVGSKRTFGRPVDAAASVETTALAGIVAYEPEELVLTAKPATPLAVIEDALAERRQMLAFEPPEIGPLMDAAGQAGNDRRGTLGGAIACNLAGPRRFKAGAARDHLLGFQAISGRGETFKSGGRVVKNVTGFDLSKLIAGSFGTLAVMTEVTVRALPAPETVASVLVTGCADAEAIKAMTMALQTPYEVSGVAHLPAALAARSVVPTIASAGRAVTAVRIEGPRPSVAFRAEALKTCLQAFGEIAVLAEESDALWREIGCARALCRHAERQVWRLSVPSTRGADVVARVLGEASGEALYDWGGGLIWLALEPAADAHAARVRGALQPCGGHATLVRATAEVRASAPVFQPQPPALAALSRRIKEAFDPHRILNPGRMVAEA